MNAQAQCTVSRGHLVAPAAGPEPGHWAVSNLALSPPKGKPQSFSGANKGAVRSEYWWLFRHRRTTKYPNPECVRPTVFRAGAGGYFQYLAINLLTRPSDGELSK